MEARTPVDAESASSPEITASSYELAGGSIVGTDHRAVPRNNQDAWYVARGRGRLCAVVCDGCGSGAHSEVGARLGARVIAESALRWSSSDTRSALAAAERDALALMHLVALQAGDYAQLVGDYLLFSVVGVLLQGGAAVFFGLGDCLFMYNGNLWPQVRYPGNAPPYLGYQLLGAGGYGGFDRDALRLEWKFSWPLDALESFLLGCDGAGRPGLIEVCEEDRRLPGMSRTVGPISQFWEDDAIFSNPDALRRRLKLIARDWPLRDPERGLLADDTTIVVGRRVRT